MFKVEDFPVENYLDMAKKITDALEFSVMLDYNIGYKLLEFYELTDITITCFQKAYPMDNKEWVFINYTLNETGERCTKFIPERKYLELL